MFGNKFSESGTKQQRGREREKKERQHNSINPSFLFLLPPQGFQETKQKMGKRFPTGRKIPSYSVTFFLEKYMNGASIY